jgi:alpha,alpha-trehalase
MQIVFGIGGEHDLSERELSHLSGWRGSRPVRLGNGAWNQRQLDIYGELLNAAYQLRDYFSCVDETRQFFVHAADRAADCWQEPDQGIWEMRGPPQHFLYSKLMCWVALDRALLLTEQGLLPAGDRGSRWRSVRRQIRQAILSRGWSERRGAFSQAFGSDALDATSLVLSIVGFLPANDPRMLGTLDVIEAQLTNPQGLVYRYRAEDGLEGEEGAFLLGTFWLAHATALAGQVERAKRIFSRAIAFTNDLGLLAEEVDSESGELLGNFPQAFSHIGLINAAWAIAQAEKDSLGYQQSE